MNKDTIIVLAFIASSYVVFGALFIYCVKLMLSSLPERFKLMRDVTSYASLSIERRYPHEHPEKKKQRIEHLIREMLHERLDGPITKDVLIDASMCITDTDARLLAIRMHETPTEQVPAQHTPPNGMRQRSIIRKTGGLIPYDI